MQLDDDTLEACLREIDKYIIKGEIPGGGNGCDPNAQRNGMILAYNLVFQMLSGSLPESNRITGNPAAPTGNTNLGDNDGK